MQYERINGAGKGFRLIEGRLISRSSKGRITAVEVTVAQQLNQGTMSKSGCFRFRLAFLRYFFSIKKVPNSKFETMILQDVIARL